MDTKKRNNLIFYIFFGLCVFFITKSCLNLNTNNKALEAYVYSQEVAENYLKSPSSAEFPTFDDNLVIVNGNEYTINAYVDSNNSFGAKIRTHYKCILLENNSLFTLKEFVLK